MDEPERLWTEGRLLSRCRLFFSSSAYEHHIHPLPPPPPHVRCPFLSPVACHSASTHQLYTNRRAADRGPLHQTGHTPHRGGQSERRHAHNASGDAPPGPGPTQIQMKGLVWHSSFTSCYFFHDLGFFSTLCLCINGSFLSLDVYLHMMQRED